MRATGTPEQDVDILADLFAEDLAEWPDDALAGLRRLPVRDGGERHPERFVELLLLRRTPLRLLLTSRKRPTWATARGGCLYGEVYEIGRNELAMDHDRGRRGHSPTASDRRRRTRRPWPKAGRR